METKDWARLLSECDFRLAADEIRDMLSASEREAASEDGHYVYKKELLEAIYAFLATPNLQTAIPLLTVAPPLYSYFESSSPGGNFYSMRKWSND